VRKIFLFLAPMVLLAIVYGCSKDHEAPTFSKYDSIMKQPSGFVAVYNKTTKEFNMSWNMSDTSSVKTYNVAWSDSNVFDLGHVQNKNTQVLGKVFNIPALDVMKTMGYTVKKDSFIVYFTVSAVYSSSQFREFIGPRSVVDSALVLDYVKK
jgi:hypothetical protein